MRLLAWTLVMVMTAIAYFAMGFAGVMAYEQSDQGWQGIVLGVFVYVALSIIYTKSLGKEWKKL